MRSTRWCPKTSSRWASRRPRTRSRSRCPFTRAKVTWAFHGRRSAANPRDSSEASSAAAARPIGSAPSTPTQMTFIRERLGNAPVSRTVISNGRMSAQASRIAPSISGTRPSSVSPRNFTVRWSWSVETTLSEALAWCSCSANCSSEREIAGSEPSRVCEEVQPRDEEDEGAQGCGCDADDLLKHGPGAGEDSAQAGHGQRYRREDLVQRPAVHADSVPSLDEGPAKRIAQNRGAERLQIATGDDAERGPVSRDDARGHRIEHDARPGGGVSLPREIDELLERDPSEQPRGRVLSRIGRVHPGHGGRVHDPRGVDEPGQGGAHAVRRVTGARTRHDDNRVPASEGGGFRVSLRGLAVRPTVQGRGEQSCVEARDRDAELVECPFADAELSPRLDVIPRDPTAAGDDEEFDALRDFTKKRGEIAEIPSVVVSRNEDGSAE